MGTQHGSPPTRVFAGVTYRLYKQYHNIDGAGAQEKDKEKLKSEGWIVKSGNVKKGWTYRERALYIRRP